MSELLTAALAYAAAGWPVFPCRPGRKVPLGALVVHGVLDATTDPAVITAWWSRCPTANVAVACGAPGPDVVDVDVTAAKPGPASLARLRDAGLLTGSQATVRTPSGGLHIYFGGTSQGNGAMPRHGIDFRGAGGYVLAPPSTVDSRPYELVASRPPTGATVDFGAIRRHLDPPRPMPRVRPGARSDVGQLVEWVAALPEGNRNSGLYWATRRAVETGADPGVYAELVDAAVTAGLPAAEAERTVRSARRGTEVAR